MEIIKDLKFDWSKLLVNNDGLLGGTCHLEVPMYLLCPLYPLNNNILLCIKV